MDQSVSYQLPLSLTHKLGNPLVHVVTHSLTQSITNQSVSLLPARCLAYQLSNPFIHFVIHSLTHTFSHSIQSITQSFQ